MTILARYFSFSDLTDVQGWALLDWCVAHGADEFTLAALTAPHDSQRLRSFFASLAEDSLPPAPRRLLSAPSGSPFSRPVERWRLTPHSLACLHEGFFAGFVSREYDEDLWLEDLTVYRSGDFLMGVLSHEAGGVLRVTLPELEELRRTGFPDRDEVPWVGF